MKENYKRLMQIMPQRNEVEEYCIYLAEKASEEAQIHPIDRAFIIQRLDDILKFNPLDFIFSNFELGSILYSNQLFVCLPEIWQQIELDDMVSICERFENIQSYFSLIKFTYKYIEIDILEEILACNRVRSSKVFYMDIIEYLEKQWNVLLKTESDLEDFYDGFIEVNYDDWMYIKQRLLLDERVKPALLEHEEMQVYIGKFIDDRRDR
jgi:hypothetical protein